MAFLLAFKRSLSSALTGFCILSSGIIMEATAQSNQFYTIQQGQPALTQAGAELLAALPLKCLDKPFPYKTGITFTDSSLVVPPVNYHPAFHGCFDWHSSVHGHWMLVRLLKLYPQMAQANEIQQRLGLHLTAANILKELDVFKGDNKSFERIYGWGWLLQLQTELSSWKENAWAQELSTNLTPLSKYLSAAWIQFLGKLAYPIRVGEHTNLAFGLCLTWDYAVAANDQPLQAAIKQAALRFYKNDKNAPATYEPGGYDFLSPTLEEADLMRRVLPANEFVSWLKTFLPALFTQPDSLYKIAIVNDRTDGKLVHLDGLNLSRSWCLHGIANHLPAANAKALRTLADKHLQAAFPNVASGDYSGEHWLASFAVYALANK